MNNEVNLTKAPEICNKLRLLSFIMGLVTALVCAGCKTTNRTDRLLVEYERAIQLERQLEDQGALQKLPDWGFSVGPFHASW